MHYTTVSVGLVEGHEAEGINDAIKQGLRELSEEIDGNLVELASVAYVPIGKQICVTVMAKPYQPVKLTGVNPIDEAARQLMRRT